jgi:hypothetical protein
MELEVVPHAYFESQFSVLMETEDRIIFGGLTHYASHLLEKCFHDRLELERSMQKAITALTAARLPASRHFRAVFVGERELQQDWLVSDLGLRLIILNADVSNPIVGRLQVEILSDGFEPMEHD